MFTRVVVVCVCPPLPAPCQGDVGSPTLTWSVSPDGVAFLPFDPADRAMATNPGLPSGGSNNNPGLAALADGR